MAARWTALGAPPCVTLGEMSRRPLYTGGGRPLGSGRQLPPQLTFGRRPLGGGGRGSWRPKTGGVAPPPPVPLYKRRSCSTSWLHSMSTINSLTAWLRIMRLWMSTGTIGPSGAWCCTFERLGSKDTLPYTFWFPTVGGCVIMPQ